MKGSVEGAKPGREPLSLMGLRLEGKRHCLLYRAKKTIIKKEREGENALRIQRLERTRSLTIIPWLVGASEVSEEAGQWEDPAGGCRGRARAGMAWWDRGEQKHPSPL